MSSCVSSNGSTTFTCMIVTFTRYLSFQLTKAENVIIRYI